MKPIDSQPGTILSAHGPVAVMLLALAFQAGALTADQGLPFATGSAEYEMAPLERFFDGTVEAVNQATVSAQTAGRISEILFDVDDFVDAGTPILRFTDVEQQAALRRSEALLQEAVALNKQADEDFSRARNLYESGTGSKRDYDQALAAQGASAARVEAARSAVREAKQQVEYTLIRAPYSGIVVARHVELGESVGVGQPLMSGLSLEALRVTSEIPQRVAAEVRTLRRAWVDTPEGRVEPTNFVIFPFADPATKTFTVRLNLPEGQHGLYPGMFARVAFAIGDARRLLVPESALAERSEVSGVYVVGEDGSVRLRQVRVGSHFGDRVEILSGLQEGETVALDPVAAGMFVKSGEALSDE